MKPTIDAAHAMPRLLLVPVTLMALGFFTACGLLPQPEPQQGNPMSSAHTTQQRGWALMYPELMQQTPGTEGTEAINTSPDGSPEPTTAAGLFDFSSVLPSGGSSTGGPRWHPSATIAVEQARQQGRPVLTLITHKMSKPAQTMENSLLLNPAFRQLAQEKLVLLRVDFADDKTRSSDLYEALKKRMKANGYPTLVLTLPDGAEIMRLSGYKQEYHDNYLKQITKAVDEELPKAVEARRKRLAREGYRLWKSKDGRDVFARLTALDANMATFTGEWGAEFKTFTNRLGDQDQAEIARRRDDSSR